MNVYDCFRILELPRNAGLDELKFAYRNKAKLYHPDRNGGDGIKFARLHEAYTFLLDYGNFKRGINGEDVRRKAGEAAKRAQERAREAEEIKRKKEAEKARLRRQEELKTARDKRLRKEREEQDAKKKAAAKAMRNQPEHKAHMAGEVLSGKSSDRDKIKAIDTLVQLKRKSVYPYLKKALYCDSEKVKIAGIKAIGQLKIIQAGPELTSLMCSGSNKIQLAILEAIIDSGKTNFYKAVLELAANDKHKMVSKKASELLGALK